MIENFIAKLLITLFYCKRQIFSHKSSHRYLLTHFPGKVFGLALDGLLAPLVTLFLTNYFFPINGLMRASRKLFVMLFCMYSLFRENYSLIKLYS